MELLIATHTYDFSKTEGAECVICCSAILSKIIAIERRITTTPV